MSTVVIGAGLAGLFAARALSKAGEDVVVLEATAHVGGRTRTDHTTFEYGQPGDLGAGFIGIGQDRLLQFCSENEIALTPEMPMFPKGPGADYSGASILLGKVVADGAALPEAARVAIATEVHASLEALEPGPAETTLAWARRAGLSDRARRLFVMQGAFNPQTRPELVSSWHVHPGSTGRVCWMVAEGTDKLARVAARGLDVQYNSPVRLVRRHGRGYRVVADNTEVDADFVVVTSSVQATRRIGFDPVLPSWKVKALLGCPMSQGGKIVTQYRNGEAILEAAGPSVLTNGAVSMFWMRPGPEDTLVVQGTIADQGDGRLRDTDATLRELDALVEAATGIAPERIAGVVLDWTTEEFVGGVVSLGTSGFAGRAALAAPVAGIHFAGEATGEWSSAMEAAARSGERAADEILAKMRSRTPAGRS